jgi:voltage-gated potassium channel
MPKNKNHYIVHDEDKNTLFERTDTKLWLFANYSIVFFILLSVVLVWMDTVSSIKENYGNIIFTLDFIISIVFLVEYIYRWYNSDQKKIFPFKILNIFDLVSFLPFFILFIFYWIWSSIFAVFRIFRIFRIFELVEKIPIAIKVLKWINKHKIEYLSVIFIIMIVVTIFSTIIYFIESNFWDKEVFSSLPITIWWWIVTMTTVWYWDMIPLTWASKIISIFLMFIWPILMTTLASITVLIFIDSTKIIDLKWKRIDCPKCYSRNDSKAKFCKNCGTKFKNILKK